MKCATRGYSVVYILPNNLHGFYSIGSQVEIVRQIETYEYAWKRIHRDDFA